MDLLSRVVLVATLLAPGVWSYTCNCYHSSEACGCSCLEPVSWEHLQSLASRFRPCDSFSFYLTGGSYYALPANFFSRARQVKEFHLELTNVTFEYLLDPSGSPFKGVSFRDRANIYIVRSRTTKGWGWEGLKELSPSPGATADVTVAIYQSAVRSLTSDFSSIAKGAVTGVTIHGSPLQSLGRRGLSSFPSLKEVSLVETDLTSVDRTHFPNPARNLKELILAKNKIRSLPDDLFTGMPALELLAISGNPITTLSEATFRPIMFRGKSLFVGGVPLHCDCKLRWMKGRSVDTKMFENTQCETPSKLKEKKIISEVSVNELVC